MAHSQCAKTKRVFIFGFKNLSKSFNRKDKGTETSDTTNIDFSLDKYNLEKLLSKQPIRRQRKQP